MPRSELRDRRMTVTADEVDALLAHDPDDGELLWLRAYPDFLAQDYAAARVWLDRAQAAGFDGPELVLDQVELALCLGEAPVEQARHANRLDPRGREQLREALRQAATAKATAKQHAAALALHREALELSEGDQVAESHLDVGLCLMNLNQAGAAIPPLQQAATTSVDRVRLRALTAMAQAFARSRQRPQALAALDRALQSIDAEHPQWDALLQQKRALAGAKRPSKARSKKKRRKR